MLLTSGWEAGGGEFFAVFQGGRITLNLKSPELDSERGYLSKEGQLLPLYFQRYQHIQHNRSLSWALCMTVSVRYSVVFGWTQRYFAFGEKNKWLLIFLLIHLKLELTLHCDAWTVSFPVPLAMLNRSYTGVKQEFNLQAPWGIWSPWWCSALRVFGTAAFLRGGNTALVVKVLSGFPVHTSSQQKSLWRVKTVSG